jgi:cadmium resistance transport/sequestration family protein
MNGLIQAMLTGVSAFAATNIDDIVILMLFFAQIGSTFRPKHIVVGQYLGFLGLILASLPGFFGGFFIPRPWLGWLGLIPMGIGLYDLFRRSSDETSIQTLSNSRRDLSTAKPGQLSFARLFNPQVYRVAGVTFANGGDNIGIYVPLFASSTPPHLGVILATFFVLIGVWCALARQLSRHPLVAKALTRYGKRIVPFVLIGLGVYIFIDSGTDHLILRPTH